MARRKRCTKAAEHSSKKSKSESKKDAELPLDIMMNILLRLSVQSLVTFSVTSKLMYALIYHPYFVHVHLTRARENGGFLVKANNRGLKTRRVQKPNPLCFFRDNEPTVQVFQRQEVGGGRHSIASSCNGLICLLDFKEWDQPICIYNPATREHVQLPLPTPFPPDDAALVYDWKINAHKVFRIYREKGWHRAVTRYEAFTLGQDIKTWRQKGIVPCFSGSKHVQADGAVYWLSSDSDMVHSVFSIDIVSEKWASYPIPNVAVHYQLFLIELYGYLSLCGITPDMEKIVIWSLKDTTKSTWEIVCFCNSPNWISRAKIETWVCPTRSSSFRLLIWRGRDKLVFYDLATRTTKRIDTSPASNGWVDLHVIDHVESLVPCEARWRAVQWPEINEILSNFCPPVYECPKPKLEIQEYIIESAEGNELELQN